MTTLKNDKTSEIISWWQGPRCWDSGLIKIIKENQKPFKRLYRGSRFKKSEIYLKNTICFDRELLATSVLEEVALRFAKDTYLPEGIFDEEFENSLDAITLEDEEKIMKQYGNYLFVIENDQGLFVNDFIAEERNEYPQEQEVLINNIELHLYLIKRIEATPLFTEDAEQIIKVYVSKV